MSESLVKNNSLFTFFLIPVLRCEPMLEDLKEMVDKLNATNDLSGFVTNLRTKFQQHVLNDV